MVRVNQSVVERPEILLGPPIVVGLDDADAVGAKRRQQGETSLKTHRAALRSEG
jgi:hypothetical protein